MCRFCAFIIVKPDGALKLIARVQQQHVLLRAANFSDLRVSSCNSGETRTSAAAFAGVFVRLLHARVDIIGVEKSDLKLTSAHVTLHPQHEERDERPHHDRDADRVRSSHASQL